MTPAVRGVVLAVNDAGEVQTMQVQTADGVLHAAVEVAQIFGMASMPPGDGAITHVMMLDGDPANLVALPPGCPSVRFGGLAAGEAVLYGADGTRVAIRAGGIVEVKAATQVIITAETASVTLTGAATLTAPGGVTVTGNVQIDGDLIVSENISDLNGTHGSLGTLRADYDIHTHVDSRGGTTTPPTPTI